ncbi:MAG: MerR family transcriptional regulator [Pseudomonadota bacterium]|nr:MerR family transcriptional regulator [Pseudomonadota bacterium]
MRIGELARASQSSVRMLRFYESVGLLKPGRAESGYRVYAPEDVTFVKKIKLLNHAGVPLKDIALLRDCLHDEPQDFCHDLRARLAQRKRDIDQQMALLQKSRALIDQLLSSRTTPVTSQ